MRRHSGWPSYIWYRKPLMITCKGSSVSETLNKCLCCHSLILLLVIFIYLRPPPWNLNHSKYQQKDKPYCPIGSSHVIKLCPRSKRILLHVKENTSFTLELQSMLPNQNFPVQLRIRRRLYRHFFFYTIKNFLLVLSKC